MVILSKEFIGTTSAAVPVKKASSHSKTSSSLISLSSKFIFNSSAKLIIVLLVIQYKQASSLGLINFPFLTMKKFSPLPSAMNPSESSIKVSSYPSLKASFKATVD